MRQIIQLTTGVCMGSSSSCGPGSYRESIEHKLYALCDDGTTWVSNGKDWEQLPSVPRNNFNENDIVDGYCLCPICNRYTVAPSVTFRGYICVNQECSYENHSKE